MSWVALHRQIWGSTDYLGPSLPTPTLTTAKYWCSESPCIVKYGSGRDRWSVNPHSLHALHLHWPAVTCVKYRGGHCEPMDLHFQVSILMSWVPLHCQVWGLTSWWRIKPSLSHVLPHIWWFWRDREGSKWDNFSFNHPEDLPSDGFDSLRPR